MKKFENFQRALVNLKEVRNYEPPYENVVLTGMVSLFEICFEQSWKHWTHETMLLMLTTKKLHWESLIRRKLLISKCSKSWKPFCSGIGWNNGKI